MSLRQRLYPEPGAVSVMLEHVQQARFVWNVGLEQRSMWTEQRRYYTEKVTYVTQAAQLAELRKELDWLRAGSSVVQQGALRDLDRAFKNFFNGTHAYPKFKKRSRREGGFIVRDITVRRVGKKWGQVLIPKVGYVRFRLSYLWADIAKATSARVTLRNGQWHIAFTTPPKPKLAPGTGRVLGIDRGVANSAATSDEEFFQVPTLTDGEQRRFVALQQQLARRHKGSGRYSNTLDKLAALRRKLNNRRTNWIEQTTTTLAQEYDLIVIEKLNITGMTRRPDPKPDPENTEQYLPNGANAKAALNRAILASCWGQFALRLSHKTRVETVNPINTSRECNKCGHISKDNRKSQAVFECTKCGHTDHADVNAAKNILERYLNPTPTRGNSGARANQPKQLDSANSIAA